MRKAKEKTMSTNQAMSLSAKKILPITLLDIAGLAFIYFVPALSHMLSLPIYFIEPMRLFLILALVHTNKTNAYILALTLPLFSFAVSAHPVLPKMLLITGELVFNVFLFFLFMKYVKNTFASIFLAIVGSKMTYYLVKFILLQLVVLKGGLVSTPILIQVITTIVFSVYCGFLFRK